MPVSVTKSVVSKETIYAMVNKAFDCEPKEIIELTEGYFNVACRIELGDRPVILKVAPSDNVDILTYEKNIMWSEVDSMKMVKKNTKVPVPKILFYDDSHTVCDRTYYFMEYLPGRSFSSCMEELSQEVKDSVFYKVGQYTKELNQITGMKFVHWDIWAGNVFVQDGQVTGIIDFERALWADELMEVGFRTYDYNKDFFAGYGREALSESEKRRALWYDIFLFQIMRTECDYRQYDNRWAYDWSGEMIPKWVEMLEQAD